MALPRPRQLALRNSEHCLRLDGSRKPEPKAEMGFPAKVAAVAAD